MCRSIFHETDKAVSISPLAVAVFAAAVYFLDMYVLMSLLFAVAVHELGHVLCLRVLGLNIRALSVGGGGLCIDYCGQCTAAAHILSAAAGPAAGLAYAYLCSYLGLKLHVSWFRLTAGMSLILSLYNLLPVLPLDGGRIFATLCSVFLGDYRGGVLSGVIAVLVLLLLFAFGLWLFVNSFGAGVMLAAVYLTASMMRENREP